jgi:two-component system, NarL family, nitrate/nitrite response regulator NarL
MKKTVKIFIADDHKLMLEGLASLIESIDGFQLIGKFNSGRELLDALSPSGDLPDICIVDIQMPGLDGVETVNLIRTRYPDLKVMALTMHSESHFVSRMIAAGANGYLLKNVDREVFIESIHRILSGSDFLSEGISENKHEKTNDDQLSNREKQILKLIALGKSNKEIASELFISDRTADTHRTNIKRKLKLNTLAQLIQYVKEHRLDSF